MEAALVLLFITVVMSSSDVGPGKYWDTNTVTVLGSPIDGVGPINYSGHSIQDRAAQCCDECLNQYPATTMIDFLDELWWCHCLTATPGVTPSTDPTYFVGTCGNAAFPDRVVHGLGSLDPSSLDYYKGRMNVMGDSSRCCEKCNSVYPGTDIFEEYGNYCYCHASLPGKKPFTERTREYADFCSIKSRNDVGPGKYWDRTTVKILGSTWPFNYSGHSIQDRAAQCCDECLNEYPATTMINFRDEMWWCDCLTATPGLTPSTDPEYVVGTCGNVAFPDLVVVGTGSLDSTSVGYKGRINVMGDSSRCCEECNSVYPGTEIFEKYGKHGNYCYCHASRPGMKPFTGPTTEYADFCNA